MDNILIFDSAADQCTGGGSAWDIAYYTNKSVNCYNYIKDNKNPIVHTLPIAGAHTVISPPSGKPFIALIHQMVYNKYLNQNESLALLYQLMNHSINVDLVLSCYTTKDGTNGTQSFTIDGNSYPLEYSGRKIYVRISKPTQEDYDTLIVHELTSSYPYEPDSDM